jgi:hypothetical protein
LQKGEFDGGHGGIGKKVGWWFKIYFMGEFL